MMKRGYLAAAVFAGAMGTALAAPVSTQDKAAADLNAAWSTLVDVAQNAAISGPDQLHAARTAQAAMAAWMKEQSDKMAAAEAQVAALTKARDAATAQVVLLRAKDAEIAALTKQVADLKKQVADLKPAQTKKPIPLPPDHPPQRY